jgi:hypothetical protein
MPGHRPKVALRPGKRETARKPEFPCGRLLLDRPGDFHGNFLLTCANDGDRHLGAVITNCTRQRGSALVIGRSPTVHLLRGAS